MEIYRAKIEFRTNFMSVKVGDRFFKVPSGVEGMSYFNCFPDNGSYPLSDISFKNIEEFLQHTGETTEPLDYFTRKVYTQEDMDKAIDKNSSKIWEDNLKIINDSLSDTNSK